MLGTSVVEYMLEVRVLVLLGLLVQDNEPCSRTCTRGQSTHDCMYVCIS